METRKVSKEIVKAPVATGDIRHAIRLRDGKVIYMPSSIPDALRPFIDTSHLNRDKEMAEFKKLLEEREAKILEGQAR
jgi:hypothetical protein